ncbi:MAG: class I SAM-dependent methyltransferase [Luteimonas sp.]
MTRMSELALQWADCPLCARSRTFVRLAENEIAVRCLGCRATPISLSTISVIAQVAGDVRGIDVYELSARGPVFGFLERSGARLLGSEYFHDVEPGHFRGEVQCQDVQCLTLADASFDLCTSTEVFEHVPDDARGFAEIRRVLRPDGIFVFTVPIDVTSSTIERARIVEAGEIEHLLPPEYHSDPIRSSAPILAFRNYGGDILGRLIDAGFRTAEIRKPDFQPWGYFRHVIVAYCGDPPADLNDEALVRRVTARQSDT